MIKFKGGIDQGPSWLLLNFLVRVRIPTGNFFYALGVLKKGSGNQNPLLAACMKKKVL